MKILVTGADGFIGSHLAERLARDGYRVTGLMLDPDQPKWLADVDLKVNRAWGDVRSACRMMQLVEGHDIVYHLAALRDVAESFLIPEVYIGTNYIGTRCVAAACLAHSARLIHTSSSEVYGSAIITPMDEGHPLVPQSPYAESKMAADAHVIAETHRGLDATIVRPFNTYGPRQATRGVIAHVIRSALAGRTVRLGNVNAKRDWVYVDDTVDALVRALDLDQVGPVNVATGRAVRVYDMAMMVFDHTGDRLIEPDKGRMRPEGAEVRVLCGDARRLGDATGWVPRVSLEEGIARTVAWWKAREKRAA